MFCTNCGLKLRDGANFCGSCGTRVEDVASSGPEAAETAPGTLEEVQEDSSPSSANVPGSGAPLSAADLFPRYWAKGVVGGFACWKWSMSSKEDAQRAADLRAREIAEKYKKSRVRPRKYVYADQRLREEIVDQKYDAVISRNAYGALILNTTEALFIDIDTPDGESPDEFERQGVRQVEEWIRKRPEWGFRIYRTAAGLRLLATQAIFNPTDSNLYKVFEELKADPLYRTLCRVQQCFRARLTPKPWRCDVPTPPARWPWKSVSAEENFQEWLTDYTEACAGYSTCRFIKQVGNDSTHAKVKLIYELHDRLTKTSLGLPLA